MGDDEKPKDLKEAIAKVMSASRKPKELAKMGMYDFDKGEKGAFKPISSYKLSFDSQQNQLEPTYYWILDWLGERGWDLKKIVDNFMASPGSGQFSDMSMRATKMQEEGMKILGGLNQVVKSVLNLVYDLKEFELRLLHYDDAKSDDKKIKEEGMLALKQIWLDNVDLKRGRGSIHQMAMELGFTTIREVFMMANSQEDLKKMNSDDSGLINDQVMRILIPRLSEFLKWVDYSEKEMRKRFSIEKNYLKSQVETIKLYSAWMKPYLVAAEKLRQKGFDNHSALVNAFSTSMFELQLFGKQGVEVEEVYDGNYKTKRGYNKVMIISFTFRGHVSQKTTQKGDYGFAMGGKVDMIFDCYALNDEELATAEKILADADMEKSMEFSMDVAGEALADLKEDLDYFLMNKEDKEKKDAETKKEKEKNEDINPFAALFGFGGKRKKETKSKDEKIILAPEKIKNDNFVEKMMRAEAAKGAARWLYLAYDIYKKAHKMASAPDEGFNTSDTEAIEDYGEGGDVGFTEMFKSKGAN